jgi:hypothetical protein
MRPDEQLDAPVPDAPEAKRVVQRLDAGPNHVRPCFQHGADRLAHVSDWCPTDEFSLRRRDMRIMARIGLAVFQEIDKDLKRVVPCVHSVGAPLESGQSDVAWPCNKEKCIVHFPGCRRRQLVLSVWRLRLGIRIERIKTGHPQQNGRHERMPLTLQQEPTRPGANLLQQQAKFDDFIEEFNPQRPHEALGMKCPAELYTASPALMTVFPSRTISSMTWSPIAAASAFIARRSISALLWPAKPSASSKSTTVNSLGNLTFCFLAPR